MHPAERFDKVHSLLVYSVSRTASQPPPFRNRGVWARMWQRSESVSVIYRKCSRASGPAPCCCYQVRYASEIRVRHYAASMPSRKQIGTATMQARNPVALVQNGRRGYHCRRKLSSSGKLTAKNGIHRHQPGKDELFRLVLPGIDNNHEIGG